jgi:uncharacterized membrane protein
MKLEFKRYGLSQYRNLTGVLQVAGSTGLLAGFVFAPFTLISSLGLAVLMLMGVAVRIEIHDSFVKILPALIFFIINSLIFLITTQFLSDLRLVF